MNGRTAAVVASIFIAHTGTTASEQAGQDAHLHSRADNTTDIDEAKVISALRHKSKFNFELF